MGLLASLLEGKPKKTQDQLAGRAVAVIEHVIHDVGTDVLVNGSLFLDKQFRLRFCSFQPVPTDGIIAKVAIAALAEADMFRRCAGDAAHHASHAACLAGAVMREFKAQSAALRALPRG